MNLTELQIELSDLVLPEEAYSLEGLYAKLADLVREENWNEVSHLVPGKTAGTIRMIAEQCGKDECIDVLRAVSAKEGERCIQTIRQSIKDATSFHTRGALGEALVQLHKRAEEQDAKSNLLAVAFADRLTDLIFPASERAAKLTDLIVREKASPQAEKCLEEACYCFFYELYSASAVMCRSVLEEVVESRMRRLRISPPNLGQIGGGHTLGALLKIAQSPELRGANMIPHEALREVHTVNKLGSKAAHQNPLSEEDASECLIAARHAITCLM